MDSGASNHICNLKGTFSSFKVHNSTVRVGDGKELKAIGIGTVELETVADGELVKIEICPVCS